MLRIVCFLKRCDTRKLSRDLNLKLPWLPSGQHPRIAFFRAGFPTSNRHSLFTTRRPMYSFLTTVLHLITPNTAIRMQHQTLFEFLGQGRSYGGCLRTTQNEIMQKWNNGFSNKQCKTNPLVGWLGSVVCRLAQGLVNKILATALKEDLWQISRSCCPIQM